MLSFNLGDIVSGRFLVPKSCFGQMSLHHSGISHLWKSRPNKKMPILSESFHHRFFDSAYSEFARQVTHSSTSDITLKDTSARANHYVTMVSRECGEVSTVVTWLHWCWSRLALEKAQPIQSNMIDCPPLEVYRPIESTEFKIWWDLGPALICFSHVQFENWTEKGVLTVDLRANNVQMFVSLFHAGIKLFKVAAGSNPCTSDYVSFESTNLTL